MSNYTKEAKAAIDASEPTGAGCLRRASRWPLVPVWVPRSALWHMRHRPYGDIGTYKQPCDTEDKGEEQ